ncbi:hypothetical protein A2U01_0086720, partial [Trifolium medium]|nr:hypothetical protein [Trifolium medium]
MMSPGEDHDVAGRGEATLSPVVTRSRQWMANFLLLGRYLSSGEPRRQGPCQTCLFDGFECK